jgi:hypothetical protein
MGDVEAILSYALEQGPALAVLAYVAWRLEARMSECVDFLETVVLRLMESGDK